MKTIIAGTMLAAFCAIVIAQNPSGAIAPVRPGIDAFVSSVPERIRGTRVGLITNHAGIDRAGTSDIDLIAAHPDVKLVATGGVHTSSCSTAFSRSSDRTGD